MNYYERLRKEEYSDRGILTRGKNLEKLEQKDNLGT